MKVLFFDIFRDNKSVLDAPPELLAAENDFAWAGMKDNTVDRFFTVVPDDNELVRGAVVHITGYQKPEEVIEMFANVPWLVHGFSDGAYYLYKNFVSVESLFHQNKKYAYANSEPMKRLQPFSTDPTITWYAVVVAKDPATYDSDHGVGDAFACFRMLKAGIAEEVFDIDDPHKGKIIRLKANYRSEVEAYIQELHSAQNGGVEVKILRTKSTSVWDFSFF